MLNSTYDSVETFIFILIRTSSHLSTFDSHKVCLPLFDSGSQLDSRFH